MTDETPTVKVRRLSADPPISADEIRDITPKPAPPKNANAYSGSNYMPVPVAKPKLIEKPKPESVHDVRTWANNDAKEAYAFILAVVRDDKDVIFPKSKHRTEIDPKTKKSKQVYKGAGVDVKLRLKAAQEILDRAFGKAANNVDDVSGLSQVVVNILRLSKDEPEAIDG